MAYRRKFADREEAYAYVEQRLATVSKPENLLKAYIDGIKGLKPKQVIVTQLDTNALPVFRAFDLHIGVAKFDEIVIHEDGDIDI